MALSIYPTGSSNSPLPRILERNNLKLETIIWATAYKCSPGSPTAPTPQPISHWLQNKEARFENGDNADLAHLVAADRVVAYIPVRKYANKDPSNPTTTTSTRPTRTIILHR